MRAKGTASNTALGCPKTAVWEMVMKHRDGLSGRLKERSLTRRREGARERGITNWDSSGRDGERRRKTQASLLAMTEQTDKPRKVFLSLPSVRGRGETATSHCRFASSGCKAEKRQNIFFIVYLIPGRACEIWNK